MGLYFPKLFARCTLRINDFIPRASDLFSRVMAQGGNSLALTKKLRMSFHDYLTFFQNVGKNHEEIHISIMKNT